MWSDVIPSLPLSSLCPFLPSPPLVVNFLLPRCSCISSYSVCCCCCCSSSSSCYFWCYCCFSLSSYFLLSLLLHWIVCLSNVYLKRQLTSICINLSHHQEIPNQSIQSIQSNKIPLLDPNTAIYRVTIFVLLALLCVTVFMGMVYHSWYKGMQKRRYDIQGKLEAVTC